MSDVYTVKRSTVRRVFLLLIGLVVGVVVMSIVSTVRTTHAEQNALIYDLTDDAPLVMWAESYAANTQGVVSVIGQIALVERGASGAVVVTDVANLGNAIHYGNDGFHVEFKNGSAPVEIALIIPGNIPFTKIREFVSIKGVIERRYQKKVVLLSNSILVAEAWSGVSSGDRVLYPWIFICVVIFGGVGGLFYSMTSPESLLLRMPITSRKVDTGLVGYVLIGSGAGLVLVTLAVKGFGLDLQPLFTWPYAADGMQSLLQLVSVAIIGGYLGLSLISRLSEEVLRKINERADKQDLFVADAFALAAKAVYTSNFPDKLNGEALESISQLAKKSNAISPNALAYSMIGEVFSEQGDFDAAIEEYNRAINLLPDKNLLQPSVLFYNRACYVSMAQKEELVGEAYSDLKKYLDATAGGKADIAKDTQLKWLKERPDFPQIFNS